MPDTESSTWHVWPQINLNINEISNIITLPTQIFNSWSWENHFKIWNLRFLRFLWVVTFCKSNPELRCFKLLSYPVQVAQSCPTLCNPIDHTVQGILQARILEWVAFPFSLLQGVFPNQRLNPGLPHCRQILYQLSHKESLFLNQAFICLCFFLIQSIFLKILNLGSWYKNKAPHKEKFYSRELLPFLPLGRKQAKILHNV